MPTESHNKAAEHHENAAKSHRNAADSHGKGEHEQGFEHSTRANEQSGRAHQSTGEAHERSKGSRSQAGSKGVSSESREEHAKAGSQSHKNDNREGSLYGRNHAIRSVVEAWFLFCAAIGSSYFEGSTGQHLDEFPIVLHRSHCLAARSALILLQ